VTALLCTIATCALQAATITWTNSAGNWNSAFNWSPNQIPGSNDVVLIPSGTVTLEASSSAGSIVLGNGGPATGQLLLNGNTLLLYGPLSVNPLGTFTLDSGELAGATNAVLHGPIVWSSGLLAGTLTVAADGELTLSNASYHDFPNTTLTNYGTVVWNSGDLRGGGTTPGTFIDNYGLLIAQSDNQLTTSGYNGYFTLNNWGTLRKSAGATNNQTTLEPGVLINQLVGALDVQQGNLVLEGSGNLNGGFISTNSTGITVLSGGSFNLNGTVTGTNVFENSGNLVGTNVINGALNWIAGNWNNTVMTVLSNRKLGLIQSKNLQNSIPRRAWADPVQNQQVRFTLNQFLPCLRPPLEFDQIHILKPITN
jgi:hypothetical protein